MPYFSTFHNFLLYLFRGTLDKVPGNCAYPIVSVFLHHLAVNCKRPKELTHSSPVKLEPIGGYQKW